MRTSSPTTPRSSPSADVVTDGARPRSIRETCEGDMPTRSTYLAQGQSGRHSVLTKVRPDSRIDRPSRDPQRPIRGALLGRHERRSGLRHSAPTVAPTSDRGRCTARRLSTDRRTHTGRPAVDRSVARCTNGHQGATPTASGAVAPVTPCKRARARLGTRGRIGPRPPPNPVRWRGERQRRPGDRGRDRRRRHRHSRATRPRSSSRATACGSSRRSADSPEHVGRTIDATGRVVAPGLHRPAQPRRPDHPAPSRVTSPRSARA